MSCETECGEMKMAEKEIKRLTETLRLAVKAHGDRLEDFIREKKELTEQVSQLTAERDELKQLSRFANFKVEEKLKSERDRLAERVKRLRKRLKEAQIMFEAMALAKPNAKEHFDHFSTQWKDALAAEDDKLAQGLK